MQRGPDRYESEMVSRLRASLGDHLRAIVVYGPAAHEDDYPDRGENLLIVVDDLGAMALRRLAGPVQWWLKKGEPWPRMFTPALLRASIDVFPIEMLDLVTHRRVAFGEDPIVGVELDRAQLRLQCERELREKLMRLREGYVESVDRTGERTRLGELLAASFSAFARIFRGCLYLFDAAIPRRDPEVVAALCARLDLSPAGFTEVELIVRGHHVVDLAAAFTSYYDALVIVEHRVDRLIVQRERSTP